MPRGMWFALLFLLVYHRCDAWRFRPPGDQGADRAMLEVFSSPQAVAVIGASREPEKLGYHVLHNIVQYGYAEHGAVYPINPNAKEILGLKCYPSVLVVPGAIDLAGIAIPSRQVMNALVEC